jgi:hypothetical protein
MSLFDSATHPVRECVRQNRRVRRSVVRRRPHKPERRNDRARLGMSIDACAEKQRASVSAADNGTC